MTERTCPELDQLGAELIEVYRRIDPQDPICYQTKDGEPNDVAVVHNAITEHRTSCPLCQTIDRSDNRAVDGDETSSVN